MPKTIKKPRIDAKTERDKTKVSRVSLDTIKLVEAEEEIRSLSRFPAENPHPVMRLSKDGTILYCNDSGSLILSEWKSQIGQPAPTRWCQLVADVFNSGIRKEFEEEYSTKTFSFFLVPIAEANYVNAYGRDITERKKVEAILQENEERFRAIAQTIPIQISISRASDGTILFTNPAYEQAFGFSEGELIGRKAPDLCYDSADHAALIDIIKERGFLQNYEVKVKRKDGTPFWVSASVQPSILAGESVFIGTSINITERKNAEAAVQKERKRLFDVLETLPPMICLLTSDYHVAFANSSFREKFGESNGRHCYEYCFGRSRPCEFCETYNVLKTGQPHHWETKGPDHSLIDVYDFPFTDEDGSPMILEMDIDITERKELEEKLFQSERKYRTLFETSLDGIVSVDMEGHIIECNEAYANMVGYTKDELKNLTYQHLTPEQWHQMEESIMTEQVLTRGYSDLFEKEHIKKDGTIFPISIRIWLMKDENGKPVGMWGIVTEITERKWMENELKRHTQHLEQLVEERTRKLKDVERMAAIGETAGMVGHDIRNPLQSIEGAVFLAKEEMKAIPSKTETMNIIGEMLDTIHEQTEYVDKIVSDLQDYAKPLEPKLEETNIQLLLNNIFAEVDVPLNIDMTIKVEQDCLTITVDPTMTKRILTNLITNAIQAMPNGGTLTIKATKKQEEAVITVQDTGTGIAEGNKHRIFQPMFTTKAKGTGFGLAVVKRLVEAHNGTVTFESQVGKGTAFTITLPTAKEGS